jgi:hypothetical protein
LDQNYVVNRLKADAWPLISSLSRCRQLLPGFGRHATGRQPPQDGEIWDLTFAFAVTAGIGFASTNITDVTIARASR